MRNRCLILTGLLGLTLLQAVAAAPAQAQYLNHGYFWGPFYRATDRAHGWGRHQGHRHHGYSCGYCSSPTYAIYPNYGYASNCNGGSCHLGYWNSTPFIIPPAADQPKDNDLPAALKPADDKMRAPQPNAEPPAEKNSARPRPTSDMLIARLAAVLSGDAARQLRTGEVPTLAVHRRNATPTSQNSAPAVAAVPPATGR
ncbi:hypothetical protein ETAA8_27060 [Anatilimnocola aggregata]|uniref:Uncharacterized protein n=1 Tax=Anatilimnocola aggregata TaxID=2528021 RepID=A0A517YBJ8_9BACT|nr:hypothetical protein [Anatilimnocola aggregata]QDU27618.1 hypothetical protein ETAA8_27060 [Anatilimnocola aggregata]